MIIEGMSSIISSIGDIFYQLSASVSDQSSASRTDELISLNAFYQGYRKCASNHEISIFVANHVKYLQWQISNGEISEAQKCSILDRCLICKALGEDVSFAGIHAISLASTSKTWRSKLISYNACRELVDTGSELSLLMVCRLQKDLTCLDGVTQTKRIALSTAAAILSADSLLILDSSICENLKHTDAIIRRRAVACLGKCLLDQPDLIESSKLSYLRSALLDKDHGTMAMSLQVFDNLPVDCIKRLSDLLKPLLFILNQVTIGNLPKGYTRGGVSGAHLIARLVRILAKLDHNKDDTKQKVQLAVLTVIEKYESLTTLPAIFVVSECYMILPHISADSRHLARIAKYAGKLLKSKWANYRSIGLRILSGLLKYDKGLVTSSQHQIISCLNSTNSIISEKAMSLIILLTTPANVQSVYELCSKISNGNRSTAIIQNQSVDIITSCKLDELSLEWFVLKLIELLTGSRESSSPTTSSTTVLNKILVYLSTPDVGELAAGLSGKLKESLSKKPSLQVLTVLLWMHVFHKGTIPEWDSESGKLLTSTCGHPDKFDDLLSFLSALRTLVTLKILVLGDDELKTLRCLVRKGNLDITCSHYLEGIQNTSLCSTSSRESNNISDKFWDDLDAYTQNEVSSKRCRPFNAYNGAPSSNTASINSATSTDSFKVPNSDVQLKSAKTVWTAKGRVNEEMKDNSSTEAAGDGKSCKDDSETAPVEFDVEQEDATTEQLASKIFAVT